eukprot:scaffold8954_cov194-Skeletonema_marinoi.AAC.2
MGVSLIRLGNACVEGVGCRAVLVRTHRKNTWLVNLTREQPKWPKLSSGEVLYRLEPRYNSFGDYYASVFCEFHESQNLENRGKRWKREKSAKSGMLWKGQLRTYLLDFCMGTYLIRTYLSTYFMGTSVGIHQLQYGELLLRVQPLFGLVADDCGTGLLIAVPLPSSTGARVMCHSQHQTKWT